VQRFWGGLAFKAHRVVYHSTRVIEKKKIEQSRIELRDGVLLLQRITIHKGPTLGALSP
jgi:hypothetical protein